MYSKLKAFAFFFSERDISDLKDLNYATILYFTVFLYIYLLARIRSVNKLTCHSFPLRQSHSQKSHCFSYSEMDVNFFNSGNWSKRPIYSWDVKREWWRKPHTKQTAVTGVKCWSRPSRLKYSVINLILFFYLLLQGPPVITKAIDTKTPTSASVT